MWRNNKFCFTVITILLVIFLTHTVSSSKILVLSQIMSHSHQSAFRAVVGELARRGHHLVVLTPLPANYEDPTFANVTEVNLADAITPMTQEIVKNNTILRAMFESTITDLELQVKFPIFRKCVLDHENRYDLVFYDAASPLNTAIAEFLNAPSVAMITYCGTPNNWRMTGNPTHPLLYGDTIIEDDGELTFVQRIVNLVKYLQFEFLFEKYAFEYQVRVEHLLENKITSVARPSKFVDLLFVDMFPILVGNRPVTPSTIILGGLHIRPRKQLPIDLQKYLDSAKNGVIYFSLGTIVLSNELPLEKKMLLLNIFKQLPYNILWKFEDDSLENVPSNVLIWKFFPQWDIFGHPNIKLFITHGGLKSVEEAILSGIPMVVMPFHWDQWRNSKIIIKHQIGSVLDIKSLTNDSFTKVVYGAIENMRYKENAIKLSKLIDDQPMKSREKAAWWIEYVLRHKGAQHLRPRAVDLPLYQYFMLDIFLFLIIIALIVTFIIYKVFKAMIRFFRNFTEKTKNKKLQ